MNKPCMTMGQFLYKYSRQFFHSDLHKLSHVCTETYPQAVLLDS